MVLCLALASMSGLAACGDDKQISSADRAAFDDFAQGARQWRHSGTDPWYAAFKQGGSAVQAEAPKAEAQMQAAVNKMSSAAKKVSNDKVRVPLQRLAATYKAKLKTIRQIDASTGSISQMTFGLGQLTAEGKATLAAWKAYVKAAKAEWNANPLGGLKVG